MMNDIPEQALRVAVVGAGSMGQHHLRVYSSLKGVELVGVIDADPVRAQAMAERHGCEVYPDIEALSGQVDAVSICTPSVTHAEVGLSLLQAGIHCLIEKPLATTEAECQSLIAAAEDAGVVLLVGHIERFNPAVRQLHDILADGHRIHAIDVRRLSAVSGRITDVDVVMDLMVHDLDVVLSLMQEPVVSVTARGVMTSDNAGRDYVSSMIRFDSGALATITASRITQNKVRELSVTTDLGLITIDYMNQDLFIYQQKGNTPLESGQSGFGNYMLDIAMERAQIRHAEPLLMELQHFVDTIRTGCEPLVSGRQALEALRLVWRIQESVSND